MYRHIKLISIAAIACLLCLFISRPILAQNSGIELNNQGFAFLEQNNGVAALEAWREAEQIFAAEGRTEAVLGAQLNQSLALAHEGAMIQACNTITQALLLPAETCQVAPASESIDFSLVKDSALVPTGMRMLGDVLLALSNLDAAEAVFEFVQKRESDPEIVEADLIALSLGNLHRLRAMQAYQNYQLAQQREVLIKRELLEQIGQSVATASTLYQEAISSQDTAISVKSSLNVLTMHQALGTLKDVASQTSQPAKEAYERLIRQDIESLPKLDSIHIKLGIAESLLELRQRGQEIYWQAIDDQQIETLLSTASQQAQHINDRRLMSFAYGLSGNLAQQRGRLDQAINYYAQAYALAQATQASDISYRWAYAQAKLTRDENAKLFYQSALASLARVREDLLPVSSELRFSFEEKVTPVYRDYIRYLVEREESIEEAIQVHNALQIAQLESLLRCGRLLVDNRIGDDTVVHIVNLDDSIKVMAVRDGKYEYHSISIETVSNAAANLSRNINAPSFASISEEDILPFAQSLYDELLKPIVESGLIVENKLIKFVVDAPFQSLPLGMLHDGEQYLIERNPVALSLQLSRVRKPTNNTDALFAGLSEVAPSFSEARLSGELNALPETQIEAISLSNYLPTDTLLNRDFTERALRQRIERRDYGIVHISTHGQFSSDPSRTSLLAWNDSIAFNELAEIFKGSSINLLFLSACETATGDERAALGLAGLAIQSGASNAIASLWQQDAIGGSVLVDRFYAELLNGYPLHTALQRAQRSLIISDRLNHPYYWAPFILATN